MFWFRLSKLRGASVSQGSSAASSTSSGDDAASAEALRRKRVQIHSLREIPTTSSDAGADYNSPDVQFILEVKRSNAKVSRCYWLLRKGGGAEANDVTLQVLNYVISA